MVSVCTTRFNAQELCALPTQCICVFRDYQRTAIVSLNIARQWVFVMETRCVYCEVGTQLSCIVQTISILHSVAVYSILNPHA